MQKQEEKIQSLFINVISGLKKSMRHNMKAKGLNLPPLHFMVLKTIHDQDNCTALTIAEMSDKDKGQVARLIKEVIDQNLVIKQPNPNDKRSQFLRLTKQGLALYEELKKADHAVLASMCSNLSPEEVEHFLEIGQKMVVNLNLRNQ